MTLTPKSAIEPQPCFDWQAVTGSPFGSSYLLQVAGMEISRGGGGGGSPEPWALGGTGSARGAASGLLAVTVLVLVLGLLATEVEVELAAVGEALVELGRRLLEGAGLVPEVLARSEDILL